MQRTFLAEVTGSSVIDHYARNIYIKLFVKIIVLWTVDLSGIKNTLAKKKKALANSFENITISVVAGLQLATYFTSSFNF